MAKATARDSAAALKSIWLSEKYSDMTIHCEEHTFKVHCNIVCPRSSFFEKAIDGKFKEAELRHVDLVEQELKVVKAVLEYIYTGDYDDTATAVPKENDCSSQSSRVEETSKDLIPEIEPVLEEPHNSENGFWGNPPESKPPEPLDASTLVFNTKIYIAADFFDIPALKALASVKYAERAPHNWNSCEFSEAADLLWKNTSDRDRQLRNIVATTAFKNIDILLDRGEFLALISDIGTFGLDVLKLRCGRPLENEIVLSLKKKSKKGRKTSGSLSWE